jgi:hypothetical protein
LINWSCSTTGSAHKPAPISSDMPASKDATVAARGRHIDAPVASSRVWSKPVEYATI